MSQAVFLDSGDVTIQVDPTRFDAWIHDGYHDKWVDSQKNSHQYDLLALQRGMNWHVADNPDVQFFMPTTAMLDRSQKYPIPEGARCRGWNGQIRNPDRYGELPAISQQLYANSLMNKSVGEIEHEIRETDRRLAGRIYDRSGNVR